MAKRIERGVSPLSLSPLSSLRHTVSHSFAHLVRSQKVAASNKKKREEKVIELRRGLCRQSGKRGDKSKDNFYKAC